MCNSLLSEPLKLYKIAIKCLCEGNKTKQQATISSWAYMSMAKSQAKEARNIDNCVCEELIKRKHC